jgi:D-sedoheptulose 7-phosphate isomerase
MSLRRKHLEEAIAIIRKLDTTAIESLIAALVELREQGGRLFFLGVAAAPRTARMP